MSASLPRTRRGLGARVVSLVRSHPVEVLLAVLLWSTYAYFYTGCQHNAAGRFAQMRTIWEDHTLAVNKYYYVSGDLISHKLDGEVLLYPNKAPATTFFGLPFFALWTEVCRLVAPGPDVPWDTVAHLTIASSIALLSTIAAVITYRMLVVVIGNSLFSLVAVLAIWLGSLAFPYSAMFKSHQQAASQLAIAFALLFSLRHHRGKCWQVPVAAAGGLLGFTLATEYPTVLLVAPLMAYGLFAIWKGLARPARIPAVLSFLLWAALGLSVLALYNIMAFGTVFRIPYQAYETGKTALVEHRLGFLGIHWPGWSNFFEVLGNITVRPQRGLLFLGVDGWRVYACNPVLWIAVPGLVLMFLKSRFRLEAALITVLILAYLAFNACYGTSIVFWGGGRSLGPRHLVPLLGLLALPIAFAARRLPWITFPLLAISTFYMLIATAIDPRVAYVYLNPPRDMYLSEYVKGHFAMGQSWLFVQHGYDEGLLTSYNLAALAGIPPRWQLVPILLLWVVLGWALLRRVSPPPATAPVPNGRRRRKEPRFRISPAWGTAALAVFALAVGLAPVASGALTQEPPRSDHGLEGRHFSGMGWRRTPQLVRVDPTIDFNWWGRSPILPPLSVEWTGYLRVPAAGVYKFRIDSPDPTTVELAGRKIIETRRPRVSEGSRAELALEPGPLPIRILYKNEAGDAGIKLFWTPPGSREEIVPPYVLFPDMEAMKRASALPPPSPVS